MNELSSEPRLGGRLLCFLSMLLELIRTRHVAITWRFGCYE
jgi:hypothetical protein